MSIPQPTAQESSGLPEDERWLSGAPIGTSVYHQSNPRLSQELQDVTDQMKDAIESIPSYIHRSSLFLILVPVCVHKERKVTTCFNTWRRRGWCRLEMLAAF